MVFNFGLHDLGYRFDNDSDKNEVARRVMQDAGVTVNDLWAFATPQLEKIQEPGNPHFTAKGSAVLAHEIARIIVTVLPEARKP